MSRKDLKDRCQNQLQNQTQMNLLSASKPLSTVKSALSVEIKSWLLCEHHPPPWLCLNRGVLWVMGPKDGGFIHNQSFKRKSCPQVKENSPHISGCKNGFWWRGGRETKEEEIISLIFCLCSEKSMHPVPTASILRLCFWSTCVFSPSAKSSK